VENAEFNFIAAAKQQKKAVRAALVDKLKKMRTAMLAPPGCATAVVLLYFSHSERSGCSACTNARLFCLSQFAMLIARHLLVAQHLQCMLLMAHSQRRCK
jgi:hypothetical protein